MEFNTKKPESILPRGTKVKCHGQIGTIVRFYSSTSYEIRLPGGVVCTDDFELLTDSADSIKCCHCGGEVRVQQYQQYRLEAFFKVKCKRSCTMGYSREEAIYNYQKTAGINY